MRINAFTIVDYIIGSLNALELGSAAMRFDCLTALRQDFSSTSVQQRQPNTQPQRVFGQVYVLPVVRTYHAQRVRPHKQHIQPDCSSGSLMSVA